MRLVICSDTHGFHDKLNVPDGDIFIHCGDSTINGERYEIERFLNWIVSLPHKYKIFINGNHELDVYKKNNMKSLVKDKNVYGDLYYLENSGVTINNINFWGSPNTPEFFYWAYMYERKDAKKVWENIPNNTDVLITHGPAYGYLDKVIPINRYPNTNSGCKELLIKIQEIKPSISAFGHIHSEYGIRNSTFNTLFINASICDDNYNIKNKPIVIDIEKMNNTFIKNIIKT